MSQKLEKYTVKSVMILVNNNIINIHFGEILKNGYLEITDAYGKTVFQKSLANTHYEVISLHQPEGKYWLSIDSEEIKTRRSFHYKLKNTPQ